MICSQTWLSESKNKTKLWIKYDEYRAERLPDDDSCAKKQSNKSKDEEWPEHDEGDGSTTKTR